MVFSRPRGRGNRRGDEISTRSIIIKSMQVFRQIDDIKNSHKGRPQLKNESLLEMDIIIAVRNCKNNM